MVKLTPHTVTCAHCGAKFEALRAEARYCSKRCSVAALRARQRPPRRATDEATVAALRAELETLRTELADPLAECAKVRQPATEPVKEKDRDRFNRLLDKAVAAEVKKLQAESDAKVEARVKDVREHYEACQIEASEEIGKYAELIQSVDEVITKDEYRKLIKCTHPDQRWQRTDKDLDAAHLIVQKLEQFVKRDPRRRKGGW